MNTNTSATYESCARAAVAALAVKYPPAEARWMVRIIFEQMKGYSPTDMIIHGREEITPYMAGRVTDTVRRLLDNEPIQYIFGTARFYGLDFKVTPATLIPRPETEQLVDMIADRYRDTTDLRILDIGTGSGCIAIALARTLKFAHIDAIDISNDALLVARENAASLHVRSVNFAEADALDLPEPQHRIYDIIVSNPPYIADHERQSMSRNVVDHEPASALFVPDHDPLLFYNAIAAYASKALRHGGSLWFEINPLYSKPMEAMLRDNGWNDIEIIADERGLARFASATLQQAP